MEQSTIRLSKKIKSELKKQMHHSGETYESVIKRLLLNSKEDDYLSKETIQSIERGIADIKAGRVHTLEQVKKRLGVKPLFPLHAHNLQCNISKNQNNLYTKTQNNFL